MVGSGPRGDGAHKDPMNNPFRSLAGRITLLVFVATIVSALTVSLISVQSLDGFLRERVNQQLPRAARQIAESLDGWYALRARELEVFAGSTILQESAPTFTSRGRRGERARNETEQYLRYVLESFPQFERLVLARPTGEALIEVGEGEALPEGMLAASLPNLATTTISEPMRRDGEVFQLASAPLVDADGSTIARLYASIDLDHLTPLLKSRELGASARVFIVDRQRRLINPPEGVDPESAFSIRGVDAAPEDSFVAAVEHYDDFSDIRVIGTQLAFPRFGWTLVIEQPYDEAFAPVVRSIGRVAALNLAIVLVVGLVAVHFLNRAWKAESVGGALYNTYDLFFLLLLTTVVHVFVFTGAFVLLGALRGRSASGFASLAVFLACAGACFWIPAEGGGGVSDGVRSAYDASSTMLNLYLSRLIDPEAMRVANDVFESSLGERTARFIAYAYTYHYLNWFSKTSVIKWHEVPRMRLLVVVGIWLVSLAVYAWDYLLGLGVLFFLSMLHVFLEFPLNWRSFIDIGGELRGYARPAAD